MFFLFENLTPLCHPERSLVMAEQREGMKRRRFRTQGTGKILIIDEANCIEVIVKRRDSSS